MFLDDAGRQLMAERNGLGSVINTPGQMLNAMNVVDRLVDSLGVAVNAQMGHLPKKLVSDFAAFWNEWKAFYAANKSWTSRLWEGTYEQTLAYQARAVEWQKRLTKGGADVTPDVPTSDKPTAPTDTGTVLKYVGAGVAALVFLFVAGKLVHTILLGGSSSREVEGDALLEAEEAAAAIMGARLRKPRRKRLTK